MALFKILRGPSGNLKDLPLKDGFCYFTPDTGLFYIDYEKDGVTERIPLNAAGSNTLAGANLVHDILNNRVDEIPSSALLSKEVDKINANKQDKITGDVGQIAGFDTNGDLIAIDSVGNAESAGGIIETNTGALIKLWYGTMAEYEAIETKDDNTIYILTDEVGGDIVANDIEYDNSVSGLLSTSVQNAIDEVYESISNIDHSAYSTATNLINGLSEGSLRTIGSTIDNDSPEIGEYSFTEGYNTIASGDYSHAEGESTKATGTAAHAEGSTNQAVGDASHAEGQNNIAAALASHVEGFLTRTTIEGVYGHAEGYNTSSRAPSAHAEGDGTIAKGSYSHAEGYGTFASGESSHSEGTETTASGKNSHAEGQGSQAFGEGAHAEGNSTTVDGAYSHAEGIRTYVSSEAFGGHAEGEETQVCAESGHAEGYFTNVAQGADYAHAEGASTIAYGKASHAEGDQTTASGSASHGEGHITTAEGDHSHSEGDNTTASGTASHAEGYITTAYGMASHTEGDWTTAKGTASHSEGSNTLAEGDYSHAEGIGTIAHGHNQHVQGSYNIGDLDLLHIVGNGEEENRSNAHTLDWSGNAWFAGDVYVGSTSGTNKDEGSKKLVTVDEMNAAIAAAIEAAFAGIARAEEAEF